MNETLLIAIAVSLGLAVAALIVSLALVARRIWQLIMSVECLCTNLAGLRAQIGHGGHEHG